MTAARTRAEAMQGAAAKALMGPRIGSEATINAAEILAAALDAYFANTRFVREVAGTTYRLKPEQVE